jgi:hypothetical protein
LGASEVAYRYLHPFSFICIVALAALGETWLSRSSSSSRLRRLISTHSYFF